MNDTFIRHLVAFISALICLLAYYSGYFSGQRGWWWTALGVIIIYGGVYKMIHRH